MQFVQNSCSNRSVRSKELFEQFIRCELELNLSTSRARYPLPLISHERGTRSNSSHVSVELYTSSRTQVRAVVGLIVIRFVENEKRGAIIALNNVDDRLQAMLGISLLSVSRVKEEMRQHESRMNEEKLLIEQGRQMKENERLEITNRLRQRRSISRELMYFTTVDVLEATTPVAHAPLKLGNSGRQGTVLSEEQQEDIR